MLNTPDLLALDEPSSSLDVETERQLLECLLGPQRRTPTVLVATNRQAVAAYAERTAVVLDGEIVDSGPTNDVLARHPGLFG